MIGKDTIHFQYLAMDSRAFRPPSLGAFESMEVSPTAPLSLKELMERASWMPKNDVVVGRQRWGLRSFLSGGKTLGVMYIGFPLVFYWEKMM